MIAAERLACLAISSSCHDPRVVVGNVLTGIAIGWLARP